MPRYRLGNVYSLLQKGIRVDLGAAHGDDQPRRQTLNGTKLSTNESLEKYNWFGSSSTSSYPHDRPRQGKPEEVTVAARMPDPIVHYCARTVVAADIAPRQLFDLRFRGECR